MVKYLGRTRLPLLFAGLTLLAAGCANETLAQASRQIHIERRIDTINRQAKDFERDNMGRDSKSKNDPDAARKTRQTRVEIEEDLNALQLSYNSIVVALKTANELRPGFALEAARSVRKHAARLKHNLALPEDQAADKTAVSPGVYTTERKSLTALCKVIYELVTNPIFEKGIDPENGLKARRDLDKVILTAERITDGTVSQSK